MTQTGSLDEGKCLALSFVQFSGAVFALGFSTCLYTLRSDKFSFFGLGLCLCVLIVSGVCPLSLIPRVREQILRVFRGADSDQTVSPSVADSCAEVFPTFVLVYSLMDVLALWMLIYLTGGAYQSIFTPLLLTVVPVIMALQAKNLLVMGFFSLTAIALLHTTLYTAVPDFVPVKGSAPMPWYLACFFLTTFLCAAFPTIAYLLNTSARQKKLGTSPSAA